MGSYDHGPTLTSCLHGVLLLSYDHGPTLTPCLQLASWHGIIYPRLPATALVCRPTRLYRLRARGCAFRRFAIAVFNGARDCSMADDKQFEINLNLKTNCDTIHFDLYAPTFWSDLLPSSGLFGEQ
jgi:hypothetical protein